MKDFRFASGESLPELRIHYRSFGTPRADAHGVVRNAVLILHGTGGSGASLVREEFAGELFGPGQPLDASRYFSCCPMASDTASRASPATACTRTSRATATATWCRRSTCCSPQGLKVNHARLVMGTSMGGMHTWLWGELHPQFMDALMPLASLPTQISGRNRVWRRTGHRCHPQRPAVAGRGVPRAAALACAPRCEMIWLHGQQPGPAAAGGADAGRSRPGHRRGGRATT